MYQSPIQDEDYDNVIFIEDVTLVSFSQKMFEHIVKG